MYDSYIKLGIAALLPAVAAVILYILDKKTSFNKLDYKVKQLIFGVVFGALAIVGTEWGIPMNGAQVNCRDAAVLVGGLMFGAPAGIIAGLIGGIERWFAVYWGVGTFTRVACSLSTIIAGFYAAALRKYMFEDRRPGWMIAATTGVVIETFHLTMVFITNMSMPVKAMAVVKACTAPMLIANGLSVLVAVMGISIFAKERLISADLGGARISQIIQRWLLIVVIFAFAITSVFVFNLQSELSKSQMDTYMDDGLRDAEMYLKSDINTFDTQNVGKTGFVIVTNEKFDALNSDIPIDGIFIKEKEAEIRDVNVNNIGTVILGDKNYFFKRQVRENYHIIALLPEDEALQMRNVALYVNAFMEIMVFALLFGLIYLLIKKVIVNQIKSFNKSLSNIAGGDLNEVVDVRTNEEFASLSDDINQTVDTLKRYIDEASKRIDEELEFAKNIQRSALPGVFPAFPKRKEFDIYATMDPAKEVGGDFYDFYITGSNKLNFLIADVSGKGIPAAMFMMRAKTELKSLTEADVELSQVFTLGNNELCDGNDAGMFVTAWQGSLDIDTGLLTFVNAGHNQPLIKNNQDKFEYLKTRPGFVLGGMEGIPYKVQQAQLVPGDIVYLYTDGVTEATNINNELYGETRLLEAMNSREFENMEEICRFVKSEVDEFVGEAPQFDDITMVALKYIGTKADPTITVEEVKISDIPAITEFIEEELEKVDCPMKTAIQFNIAIDEIVSNVVKFAYPKKPGPVSVTFIYREDPDAVYLKFSDYGIPYNPLTNADPDVTLSAEERKIGGLGIYMVKQSMDEVKYKYENDQNILTIKKLLDRG